MLPFSMESCKCYVKQIGIKCQGSLDLTNPFSYCPEGFSKAKKKDVVPNQFLIRSKERHSSKRTIWGNRDSKIQPH